MNRRKFLQTGALAAAGLGLSQSDRAEVAAQAAAKLTPTANAMIMIWLPGGMAQTDLWDPKKYTPFQAGMKGSEMLGTCKAIPTSADGIFLGEGLETSPRSCITAPSCAAWLTRRSSAPFISRRNIT